jgi:serine/threonine protein kinase
MTVGGANGIYRIRRITVVTGKKLTEESEFAGERYHDDGYFLCAGEAIPMENQANKKFGRYEILAELGRGAMGIVYKAHDPQIGRVVALKTVLLRAHDPEEEEEFRKRFLCEAQAAGRLHHPGIVAIYDAGEDRENYNPYMVLEFVSGEPLSRILAREKKFPLARALQLAEEIATALDYAHAQGVVHRDIKPANILVTEEGRAKITDFGIAKLNLAHFTLVGRVLGTPAYMAPEQLSGEGVDGRSDLFSLGVILYGMVTGHSPFQGSSATTVCFKVVNRDPMPVSALDMDLPPALDAVIFRAMAKDPARRYQSGSEFAAALHELKAQAETTTSSFSMPMRTESAEIKTNYPGMNPNAVAGLLQAESLLRQAVPKTLAKYFTVGAALVVTIALAAIPIHQAIIAHKAAAEMEAREKSISASYSAASAAKPRDSIVAEMEVATPPPNNVPAPPIAAAPPPQTHTAPKARPKRTGGKTGLVASATPPAAPIPVAAQPAAVPTSTLELAIEHQFKEAVLFVWVDDRLVLTRPLHGGTQKRLVVFKGIHGVESESVQVPAGTHQLRVRAQSSDQSVDLSKTISGEFAPNGDETLQITFDKHNTAMRLAWQK